MSFTATVLAVGDNRGLARWHARFTRAPSGAQVELDGVLAATFDAACRCVEFREWWRRAEATR